MTMMMKILLMLSLAWTAYSVSSVSYPTTEAAAEKMMLELKKGNCCDVAKAT